ncbi:4-oxalocrotonate tautomerase family protein [Paraburkholderia sp. BR13439]|uniref:tautomerase family protein n=1 Tax=unclassified Paraburkholderia TaxID=2615204 RepID=UPI0034CF5358
MDLAESILEQRMPIVRIEMLKGRTREQKQELVDVFTSEMACITKCAVTDVQVIITEVDSAHWAVGGVLPSTVVGDEAAAIKLTLADMETD